jgi:hypothetical protein
MSTSVAAESRALVAIFDTEVFSESKPDRQADQLTAFLESLSIHIGDLRELHPDRLLTGNGAIVQIGRTGVIDAVNIKRFLDFAVAFTSELCEAGVAIRTALNYSQGDRLSWAPDDFFEGQYVLGGDTIKLATRALAFCEPGEIIVTGHVRKLLRTHSLEKDFPLYHNEPLLTKQGLSLDTYSYDPPHQAKGLYSPRVPSHRYKRFTTFPRIHADTLQDFLSNGLESELRKVVSNAYTAISQINESRTFLSSSEVLNVLAHTNYDADDTVFVISRNDRPTGFWTQRRQKQYIDFLAEQAAKSNGYINQTRIWIFDDIAEEEETPKDSVIKELQPLHAPDTLYRLPAGRLHGHEHLSQLIFGVTLSLKHGYAIIPAPSTDALDAGRLRAENIGELLWQHREYDDADGPMKAIITADSVFVATLVTEFNQLLDDARSYRAQILG